ncbi:hypothetical protein LguiA_008066 [Lonicera macranthoides]
MKMDAATTKLTRPSVAWTCIEMDLLKKFPARIWIGSGTNGFQQKVTPAEGKEVEVPVKQDVILDPAKQGGRGKRSQQGS